MIEFYPVTKDDFPVIKKIYDYYILNSTATFHTEKIAIEELKEFIFINHPKYPSFLIKENGGIIGYCFLTRHKKRQAYDRTADMSLYFKPEYTGKENGIIAVKFLETAAIKAGIKVLVCFTSGDNLKSISLLKKMQYKKCAHFKNIGEKSGKILDVIAYQKEL
jgi:L-amino acid N-acyltransferase YncA